jgi:hypothetical protein
VVEAGQAATTNLHDGRVATGVRDREGFTAIRADIGVIEVNFINLSDIEYDKTFQRLSLDHALK